MLQIPGPLCGDPKADKIINQYINDRLIAMMSDILIEFDREGLEDDPAFAEEIFFLFPENYEKEKQTKTFLKLYDLLMAEETYAPEQIMEYVLAQLIGLYEEMGGGENLPLPDRAYVEEKLLADYRADGSRSPEADVKEYLDQIEDPAQYLDLIFWDLDFTLLEQYKEEDLARSNPAAAGKINFEE